MMKYSGKVLQFEMEGATSKEQEGLLKKPARDIAAYFVRAIKGRPDIADTILSITSTFDDQLEALRTSLSLRDFDTAEKRLQEMQPPEDQVRLVEYNVEKARFSLLTGKLPEAIKTSSECLAGVVENPLSQMTLLQIRGQARFHLGEVAEAKLDFISSSQLLSHAMWAQSGLTSLAYLVKIESDEGAFLKAQETFDLLNYYVQTLKPDLELWCARLLLVVRAEYHLARSKGDSAVARQALIESNELAKWSHDRTLLKRIEAEMKEAESCLEPHPLVRRHNWTYIPRQGLLIDFLNKTVDVVLADSVYGKFILKCQEGIAHEELFFSIWGIGYDKERHANHLRAIISKIRKKLPVGTVVNKDGRIYL